MILEEVNAKADFVAIMPLAKWLSKRFNLPLNRNEKPPKRTEEKTQKVNEDKKAASKQELGKIPKLKQEPEIPRVMKQEPGVQPLDIQDSGSSDDLSFYSGVEALKRRQTVNRTFISTDAAENADIKDEAWNQIKNLKSDEERMNHAQKKFGNRHPGDPNRCMNIHGYRRCHLAKKDAEWQKLRSENQANSMFYETRSKNTVRIKDGKIETIFTDPEEQDPNSKKRKAGEHDDMPGAKKPKLMTFQKYEQAWCAALIKYKKDKLATTSSFKGASNATKYWMYYLRHFKNSIEETHTFLKYYGKNRDSENNLMMSSEELKANECAEMIFAQFVRYYGPNPVVRCKDCEEIDQTMGAAIMHPY